MRKDVKSVLLLCLLAPVLGFSLQSCSVENRIPEGEMALVKNSVEIQGPASDDLRHLDLNSYIKQHPASFKLFKYVPEVYSQSLTEATIESIRSHMDYIGHYSSEVRAETDTVKGRNKIKVRYSVTPGSVYTIDSLSYVIPDNPELLDDFFADTVLMSVKPGNFLSESSLASESERFAAYLRTKGYYGITKNNFSFVADTLEHDGTASLELTLSSSRPINKYYINKVTINRPVTLHFRDNILKDMNLIRPGSLYDEDAINKTYTRLAGLKVFSSVGVKLTQSSDDKVDCDISLTQSQIHGFKLSLEASTNSVGLIGISPQLGYTNKNLFRGGEWLSVNFLGNYQFRFNDKLKATEFGVSSSLSVPRFVGIPVTRFTGPLTPRTELNLSYNYQNRPEYTRTNISSSYGYSGMTRHRVNYQFYPIRVNLVKLMDIDEDFSRTLETNPYIADAYRTHIDAGIGGTVYYSTSSELVPKTTYSYARLSADLSGNLISLFVNDKIFGLPYSQYLRGELTLGHTWKFGRDNGQAVATRFLAGAGYAYGASNVLPFERQFYAGGANSLRGWQARSVGPGFSKLDRIFFIPSQTGDFKLEVNAEYRFSLFWKMEGAAFLEAGNVWALNKRNYLEKENPMFSFSSIAADWGLGIRCNLDFLIIRIDGGFRIHDPGLDEGERWLGPGRWFSRNGYAIHFGVGYPF